MAENWKTIATSSASPVDYKVRTKVSLRIPDLDCDIEQIEWLDGIPLARERLPIEGPHWLADQTINEFNAHDIYFDTGSLKPAAYIFRDLKHCRLAITIKIDNCNVSGAANIKGQLGKLTFSGEINLNGAASSGTHKVIVDTKNIPQDCQHFEGDAEWSISPHKKGTKKIPTKTRLEVFFIYGAPAKYYDNGVWVEVLRVLFKKSSISGKFTNSDIASAASIFCHSQHGVIYDCQFGASNFGAKRKGSDQFELMRYLFRVGLRGDVPENSVNCYDQAAAIQCMAGALGVILKWYFLMPFGFIKTTDLVGIGPCNNPFFKKNGSNPIVELDDPDRIAFGNHAFTALGPYIIDACAGPHVGKSNLASYLRSSIDMETTMERLESKMPIEMGYKVLEGATEISSGVQRVV